MLPRSPWLLMLLAGAASAGAPDAGAPKRAAPPAARSAEPAAPPFQWDIPDVVEQVEVGPGLAVNGRPLKVFAVRTKLKPAELYRHVLEEFVKAKLYVPERPVQVPGLKLPHVTGLDVDRLISFVAWFWPEADGTTTAILGAADLNDPPPGEGVANGLPVFPGATQVAAFTLELATALTFRARATDAEVIGYYRATLPTLGWKEREKGTFVKGKRRVRVVAKDDAGALAVAVVEEADTPAEPPATGQ